MAWGTTLAPCLLTWARTASWASASAISGSTPDGGSGDAWWHTRVKRQIPAHPLTLCRFINQPWAAAWPLAGQHGQTSARNIVNIQAWRRQMIAVSSRLTASRYLVSFLLVYRFPLPDVLADLLTPFAFSFVFVRYRGSPFQTTTFF